MQYIMELNALRIAVFTIPKSSLGAKKTAQNLGRTSYSQISALESRKLAPQATHSPPPIGLVEQTMPVWEWLGITRS